MADNIGALAMRSMQHLDDHGSPSLAWIVLTGYEDSRATGVKHLHFTDVDAFRAYVQHDILVVQEDDRGVPNGLDLLWRAPLSYAHSARGKI
jgi:hypothetical protein